MNFAGIGLIIVGIIFVAFGFAIRFKNKYSLINDFIADKNMGILDDKYAKQVGNIEFFGGIILSLVGVFILFATLSFPILLSLMLSCVFGMCATLLIHRYTSIKRIRGAGQRG